MQKQISTGVGIAMVLIAAGIAVFVFLIVVRMQESDFQANDFTDSVTSVKKRADNSDSFQLNQVTSTPNEEQRNDNSNDQIAKPNSDPVAVVREYYDIHIKYLNANIGNISERKSNYKGPDSVMDRKYVTQNLINSHNRTADNFDPNSSYPGWEGDPFLCGAQDFPDDLSKATFSLIKNAGNEAIVKAKIFVEPFYIKVYLVKEDEIWKVDGIYCSEGRRSL